MQFRGPSGRVRGRNEVSGFEDGSASRRRGMAMKLHLPVRASIYGFRTLGSVLLLSTSD